MDQPPYEPYPVSPYPAYPAPSDRDRQLPPPSKTTAGWALGLAIIPSVITWVIAVVFACMVISRSKDGREHGRRMAVAALVIVGSWVAIGITVIAVLVATQAERDESGRVTDSGRATIVDLRVGDCLPAPAASEEERLAVEILPCSEPHDAEVYANFDLAGEWTTAAEVDRISEAGCAERFADYVGVSFSASRLQVLFFRPVTRLSFDRDSAVVCVLVASEPLAATLRGSRR